MATRKKATSKRKTASKDVAVRGSTDIADINAALAAEVDGIASRIGAPAGNKIKTGDKVFELPNGEVRDELEVVIVDFINRNDFYESAYDPNTPEPPSCYSMGKIIADMVPGKKAIEAQADNCAECPNNQFGSAGAGKACKNTRLLAVIPADADPESDLMTLSVSPTAIKSFDSYVKTVATVFQAPPLKVVTRVTFHPEKHHPQLVFSDPQPNANFAAHFARRAEAESMLTIEPEPVVATKPTTKKKRTTRRRA